MAPVPHVEPEAPGRILVVDDEQSTRWLMEMTFQMEGFTVISAKDGEEALAHVQECDVVLLDLMMPGMDGMTVLRRVRSNPKLAGLPILMFTARTDGLTARIAKAEGVSGFHTKPVDMDHLVIDVRRLAETRIIEQRAAHEV